MSKMIRLCVLVGLLLVLSGCVSVGENNNQNLPWSQPAGWEDQMIGVPID